MLLLKPAKNYGLVDVGAIHGRTRGLGRNKYLSPCTMLWPRACYFWLCISPVLGSENFFGPCETSGEITFFSRAIGIVCAAHNGGLGEIKIRSRISESMSDRKTGIS